MRTETLPPVQGLLTELHERLGVELEKRRQIERWLTGDEKFAHMNGKGLSEHDGIRLCRTMLELFQVHQP